MNPINATEGHAGTDYSSSVLIKPRRIFVNQVCREHQYGSTPEVRDAFPVRHVYNPQKPYLTELERVEGENGTGN